MLQSVSPVNQRVTEYDDLGHLQPPGLRRNGRTKSDRHQQVQPLTEVKQSPNNQAIPDQVLPQKKAEIQPPVSSQESLT